MRYVTRDGRVFTWTGHGVCVCTKCDEVFNSVHAFDAHIRRAEVVNKKRIEFAEAVHDFAWMPRNKAGRLVTSLREEQE